MRWRCPMTPDLGAVKAALGIKPCRIDQPRELERLLSEVWDDLGGNDLGMAAHKLIGRMEQVQWNPPVLTFVVERHGGTVLGSTRAQLQRWSIDVDRSTATCERAGHRPLSPMAERIDIAPIADEVAGLIIGGVIDDRLRWLCDGRVRVEMGRIFSRASGY